LGEKSAPLDLNKKNRFRYWAKPRRLELVLYDEESQPIANEEYEIKLQPARAATGFKQKNTHTDGDGCLKEPIPHSATAAMVVLPRIRREFSVDICFAAPLDLDDEATLVRAVQQRLNAAGYYCGPEDGILGPVTRAALKRFQQACKDGTDTRASYNGEVDGKIGGATKNALKKWFGY
jgi:hypothetical protein